MTTNDEGFVSSPRPLLYRRAYELTSEALAESNRGETGSVPAEVMSRLVAEVEAELGDHAEAREAIEDGVRDAVMGHPPIH
jgi:hypothetical protein